MFPPVRTTSLHRQGRVAAGNGQPLEGVKAQGAEHLTLIDRYPEVKNHGWLDEGTTQLKDDVAFLSTVQAQRADASDGSVLATVSQEKAVDAVKKKVRTLRNVLPTVLAKAKKAGVVIEERLFASGRLGRKVPALLAYLTTVEPTVKRIDSFLQPYMKGALPSEQLAEARKALAAADQTQEASKGSTTEYTAQLNETKGRVIAAVEELNGIAANAYDGNAEVIAKFNKDLLLRARRERAAKEAPKPE